MMPLEYRPLKRLARGACESRLCASTRVSARAIRFGTDDAMHASVATASGATDHPYQTITKPIRPASSAAAALPRSVHERTYGGGLCPSTGVAASAVWQARAGGPVATWS